MIYSVFRWPIVVTAVVLIGAAVFRGPAVAGVVGVLGVLEISLSFDNAVVNASVLRRMSPFWQQMFLTVGILIAVVGMRLAFPLLVVGLTAGLNPFSVVRFALTQPDQYRQHLDAAHPAIAAFGGIFLVMIFLNFIFEERDIRWISVVEKPFARVGKIETLAIIVTLIGLFTISQTFGSAHRFTVLAAGVLGLACYLAVDALGEYFSAEGEGEGEGNRIVQATGRAAFFLFLYLEVLDSSFSFDGVMGAFAVSSDIFVIAAGLGIGAAYIRALTVYLVRAGTLEKYAYLEHGAHYAIGALGVVLLASITYSVPQWLTSAVGMVFILAALFWSFLLNRRVGKALAAPGGAEPEAPETEAVRS